MDDYSDKNRYFSPQVGVFKRNCAELGYYDDEYIKYFSPKTWQQPLRSLSMCTRVIVIRKVVERFFECFGDGKVQFVNLGCGLDTTSLWVLKRFPKAVCFDSDLEFQTKLKTDIFKNSPDLLRLFPRYETTESSFHSDRYHIFPIDLRFVDQLDKLKQFGFSDELPTIFLSEFVLLIIESDLSDKVIEHLYNFSKGPSMLMYQEYSNSSTPVMKLNQPKNIEKNFKMYSPDDYPNAESQVKRYKDLGWEEVYVHNLTFVYNHMIDKRERSRLRKIENFNDMKNLGVYLSHTVVGVAFKNPGELKGVVDLLQYPDPMVQDEEDELLPEYEDKDLEAEFDRDFFVKFYDDCHSVTLSFVNEECKTFYDKFK